MKTNEKRDSTWRIKNKLSSTVYCRQPSSLELEKDASMKLVDLCTQIQIERKKNELVGVLSIRSILSAMCR